jgi:FlgD Ig-like domain
VRNNIFYENGTPGLRGRGFCAVSDSTETITHNVFYGNVIAALLVLTPGGPVNVSAMEANDYSLTDFMHSNLDGDPLLVDPDHGNWRLFPGSPAIDAGDPAAGLDPDGTAPDAGPFYFDQNGVAVPRRHAGGTALLPSVPNPFRGQATLPFVMAQAGRVRLEIFDLRGRKLATLLDGVREAGPQSARWDGKDDRGRAVGAGVYVAKLSGDGIDFSRRIVLVP